MNTVSLGCQRFVVVAAMVSLMVGGGRVASVNGLPGNVLEEKLTIEQLLEISHPGPPMWSPQGNRIAFMRELDGAVDLWWTTQEHDEPVPVTSEAGSDNPGTISGFVWTASGGELLYVLQGNLYRYDIGSGSIETLISDGSLSGGPTLTTDGLKIALVRDGQPWIGSFPGLNGSIVGDHEGSFRDLAWSPDGRFLVVLHSSTETIAEDTAVLMGDKIEFSRHETNPTDLGVIDVASGDLTWLERSDAYASEAAFSPAGMLAWQETAHNAKQRRILVASPLDWLPRVVVDEYDKAWWTLTYLETGPRWNPDTESFVFLSERDGWTHVYMLDASDPDAEAFPLTAGEFEVEEPVWSPDGRTLLLAANRGSLTERGLHLLDVPMTEGELPELEPISQLRGTSTFPRWRPDGQIVAFLHADPENPLDLWVQEPRPDAAEQLTDTWPEAAAEDELITPQTVRFSSADGELVPAQVFLPRDYYDHTDPVPVVVWVHGGGYRQNRYGWHPRRVYSLFYGFHQYLLQRGFMVVMVDYRGSIGYGRDFRQGQYLDLGGRDLDDVLATVRYLERVDDVDIGKVGVWGISYGGYLTMQALVQAPTAFDAGVNIAGVVDWLDWAIDPGGLWIDGRMESPEEHPDLYQQRSPIHFVDQLARPLLILHGTADHPVPALQTFRLIDALVRADKSFEAMVYPGEQHDFLRSHTWRDAFRRVESFFDATLR